MRPILFAPTGYWCLTPEGKKAFCNGCGSGLLSWAVPDNLLGLDITECCNIHDYTYATAEPTIEAKASADRAFLNNMVRSALAAGGDPDLLRQRLEQAWLYYEAVHKFGGPAFWAGKNKHDEERAA